MNILALVMAAASLFFSLLAMLNTAQSVEAARELSRIALRAVDQKRETEQKLVDRLP